MEIVDFSVKIYDWEYVELMSCLKTWHTGQFLRFVRMEKGESTLVS